MSADRKHKLILEQDQAARVYNIQDDPMEIVNIASQQDVEVPAHLPEKAS